MSSNEENMKKDIKDKANDVYEKGKYQASKAYEEGKDKAESTLHSIKDTASTLYEEGKKQYQNAESYIGESTDELIKHIKEKPLSSVLIAGAAGWLLSKLLKK